MQGHDKENDEAILVEMMIEMKYDGRYVMMMIVVNVLKTLLWLNSDYGHNGDGNDGEVTTTMVDK